MSSIDTIPSNKASELKEQYYSNKEDYDTTLAQLDRLFGADRPEKVEASSFLEYEYRKLQFGRLAGLTEGQDEPDWALILEIRPILILETARAIQLAVEILRDQYGVDILQDRKAISNMSAAELEALDTELKLLTDEDGQSTRGVEAETMGYVVARDIVSLFGGNKKTYENGIANTLASRPSQRGAIHPALLLASRTQESFYQRVVGDISSMRYDTHRDLKALHSDKFTNFLDYMEQARAAFSAPEDNSEVIEKIIESQKQELDYTIFPQGTELETIAHDIVAESSEYTRASVDLKRLAVLEEIRQLFGPEKCYLMRGKESGKVLGDENGRLISEDYIGLIMQHHDADGQVTREDCLAISPIAGKHAGYLVRQDASAGISWREILSLPKKDAIDYFNARRLRFDPAAGRDKYDEYVKKVVTLLTCDAEKFGPGYRLRRRGEEYELIFRASGIGNAGLNAAAFSELFEQSEVTAAAQ